MAMSSPPICRVPPSAPPKRRYSEEVNAAGIIAAVRSMEQRIAEEMKKEMESPSQELWNRIEAEREVNLLLQGRGNEYAYRPMPERWRP